MSGIRVALEAFEPVPLVAEFDLPERGLAVLVGARGSGKSHLLRVLAGLDPARGVIEHGGRNWHRSSARRRPVTLVFPEPRLLDDRSVAANLAFGGHTPNATVAAWAQQTLNAADSTIAGTLKPATAHRLALARGAFSACGLLLVDEPAGLTFAERHDFLDAVAELAADAPFPVLLASGSLAEAGRLSDRIVLLDRGRITASGKLNDLVVRPDLPLRYREDAVTRIRGVVASHDVAHAITHVDSRGGRFCIPRVDRSPGKPLGIVVHASRTWLAAEAPAGATSVLSVLPAEVNDLAEAARGEWVVVLKAADVPLLARVADRAKQQLKLKPGRRVYAMLGRVETVAG